MLNNPVSPFGNAGKRAVVLAFAAITCGMTNATENTDIIDYVLKKVQENNPDSVPHLYVPTLAYDETSVDLVWTKPKETNNKIVDFKIYQDGYFIGFASDNNSANNPAHRYFQAFYAEDSEAFHHKIAPLNFKATGLVPDTDYTFSVSAVYENHTESLRSNIINVHTIAGYAHTVNIENYGAVGDGTTVNTAVIQKAFDDCATGSTSAFGCKVTVPAGRTFVTGALFMHSNMTLEIEEGAVLKGSTNPEDYPISKGYQLYSYKTNATDSRRPPSLLNALSEEHFNTILEADTGYDERRNVYRNIRVVGKGTLDGSGWVPTNSAQSEAGEDLLRWPQGSRQTVFDQGLLAKNQLMSSWKAIDSSWSTLSELLDVVDAHGGLTVPPHKDLYSNKRSSLTTFRGVTNIYFSGLNLTNPAYHGVMFLESDNVVFSYTNSQTFDINNADGVEFGNTTNSIVYANFFDTGDDCINFGAGQGADYLEGKVASGKSWIFNNYTREGHGAVVLGSHTGAGINDIVAEQNISFFTDRGLRMKSTTTTGGGASRIWFMDNAMKAIGNKETVEINGVALENGGGTGEAIIATLAYKSGSNTFEASPTSAQFKDVTIKNVTIDNVSPDSGKNVVLMEGYDGSGDDYPKTYQENVVFDNVKIKNSKIGKLSYVKNILFHNVEVTNWDSSESDPWLIENSENVIFSRSSCPFNSALTRPSLFSFDEDVSRSNLSLTENSDGSSKTKRTRYGNPMDGDVTSYWLQ